MMRFLSRALRAQNNTSTTHSDEWLGISSSVNMQTHSGTEQVALRLFHMTGLKMFYVEISFQPQSAASYYTAAHSYTHWIFFATLRDCSLYYFSCSCKTERGYITASLKICLFYPLHVTLN